LAENSLLTGACISWKGKLSCQTHEKDGKEQAVFEIAIARPGSRLERQNARQTVMTARVSNSSEHREWSLEPAGDAG
jgi:hypothetical protein